MTDHSDQTLGIVKSDSSYLLKTLLRVIGQGFITGIIISYLLSHLLTALNQSPDLRFKVFVFFSLFYVCLGCLITTLRFLFSRTIEWHVGKVGIRKLSPLRKEKFIPYSDIKYLSASRCFLNLMLNNGPGPAFSFISDEDRNFIAAQWIKSLENNNDPLKKSIEHQDGLSIIRPRWKALLTFMLIPHILLIGVGLFAVLCILISESLDIGEIGFDKISTILLSLVGFGVFVILVHLLPFLYYSWRKWSINSNGVEIRRIFGKNRILSFDEIRCTGGSLFYIWIEPKTGLFQHKMMYVSQEDRALLSRAWARSRVDEN